MSTPFLGLTGAKGESLARSFLEASGLTFITANARVPGGEIDLVMRDPASKEIVFVEVRTRTFNEYGTPEASITPSKRHYLERSIKMYMQNYPWNTMHRLDLVAVVLTDKEPIITHYKYLALI